MNQDYEQHRNIQIGAWVEAVISKLSRENWGEVEWETIRGRVVHVERYRFFSVLYLSNNKRVNSEYVTKVVDEKLLAA